MSGMTLTKRNGIKIAREFKLAVSGAGLPVIGVYLFGSLAKGKVHRWSDVDIAVVYRPFGADRLSESRIIRKRRNRFDVPMDIVCLRAEDMKNDWLGIAREVKQNGIAV
ncbi:hypothetical protein A3A67_00335 [Candidatus Peribacteria bacterium RIFCSPLOWO2_01_FULL_51_18]|nr:MAG: hypothetical protein A3C52_00135 [Candidatus Peribacteria bacterium RIFCSPHIGHO2_02_FULL_51_15]OGJ66627.1 MAG: hypothetical protein A3A67_00335 [Candidatus Peribacteria bacterium RIFCSPLOWO2_01_FULL_51_18]OGJ69414.1 MAG: hypothetical protein A3J34_05185 [Candidatus Peribacteria bacterium RIFCSPLOWO2_02_FULL_51_10]